MEKTHKAEMLSVMKCEKNTAIAMERIEDLKVNVSDRLEKAIEELQVQVASLEAP